ncbi:MAG: proteasome assembly chaperone family protein [Candidatus Diapherotrites archaeon]|nr:proteasome assembly chaperone family protein [Candidatus Diapherotrites archaeon]
MNETYVVVDKEIKLNKPVLIEGLPGLGLVGKIAADYMISELGAKKFAEMYSPFFPPQVVIQPDGTVRMMRNEFYYWHNDDKSKSDLLFIVGDHQGNTPESHYELVSKTVDVAEMLGAKLVYTLGGFATGRLPKKPKVFGAVTDKSMIRSLKSAGVSFERSGVAIVGAAGLLLGESSLRGMKGACLMGETHGQIIDARAAKSVLLVLQNLLDLKLDLGGLEKRAKETEQMIERAEKAKEQQQVLQSLPAPGEGPTYIR